MDFKTCAGGTQGRGRGGRVLQSALLITRAGRACCTFWSHARALLESHQENIIQATNKLLVTFEPDERGSDSGVAIETGLFLGVREEPALESTQLRWQVRLHPGDIIQVEDSATYLENLGGALFLTTKEAPAETQPGDARGPIGWMRWLGDNGRRSFQIQLAISGVGFDRVCHLAEKGQYPDAMLTFKEDGPIEHGFSPEGNKKIWTNAHAAVALIAEFTLRYDFAPFVRAGS